MNKIAQLKVTQSVLVANMTESQVQKIAKELGFELCSRKEKGLLRVWRTK